MTNDGNDKKSGVVSIAPPSTYTSREILCHQIIDAASALTVDVDFVIGAGAGDARDAAAHDARRSIERIVKLVGVMRSFVEGAPRVQARNNSRMGT